MKLPKLEQNFAPVDRLYIFHFLFSLLEFDFFIYGNYFEENPEEI